MKIPNIKNAYLNIQETCQKRLSEIYPHRIPEIAQNRLDKELAFAKNSKYLDDFEIYRQLSNEAQKCCLVFTLRGTLAGSYLTYLMGSGRFNPLPSHYYCQHCGHFETISTHLYGIDLPENICPECGSLMLGDGFNLSLESVWGLNGDKILSFDYNICEEFRPFAKKILTKIYPENEIVPWGVLSSPCGTIYEPSSFEVSHGGFVILPTGQTMDDYQELKTYLEDGEPCLSGFINILESHALKRITLLPLKAMEYLITLQRKTAFMYQKYQSKNYGRLLTTTF